MMRCATFFLTFLAISLIHQVHAQNFPGVGKLKWGATEAEVIAQGNMGNTNLVIHKMVDIIHSDWNKEPVAVATGFAIAPPAKAIIFTGPRNEKIEYFLANDQLGLVVHMPPNNLAFSPDRCLSGIDNRFGDATDRRERVDIKLPIPWGRYDERTEYCLVTDWESTTGIGRAFCRTWPINDRRQIYRVYYMSKTQVAKNDQRLVEWAVEEAARIAETKRKVEEEAARRAAEAAAAKAASK